MLTVIDTHFIYALKDASVHTHVVKNLKVINGIQHKRNLTAETNFGNLNTVL